MAEIFTPKAIRFSKSESWRDYRGVHNCTLIFDGKAQIGMIEGDSGCGGMDYVVTINGKVAAQALSLKDAKQRTRDFLSRGG